jgi:hypothetical protein
MLIHIDTDLLYKTKLSAHQYIIAYLLLQNITELRKYVVANSITENDIAALVKIGYIVDMRIAGEDISIDKLEITSKFGRRNQDEV